MISSLYHKERTSSGEPLYLVYTPNSEFEGTRYGVRFYKGKGKTANRQKAWWLHEVHGYEVVMNEEAELFTTAEVSRPPEKADWDEETELYLSDEEIDGDE